MPFFLVKILESILPFLFSALKRSWDNLTKDQQNAIINSGMIGQYLKNNLNALSGDLVAAIAKATGLPAATIESTLLALAVKFGYKSDDVDKAVTFLQDKLKNAASNEDWNGLLTIILNAGGTLLSGGSLDWVHLALGLGEFAYQKFVSPRLVETISVPSTDVTKAAASVSVAAPAANTNDTFTGAIIDISASQNSDPAAAT